MLANGEQAIARHAGDHASRKFLANEFAGGPDWQAKTAAAFTTAVK
jgi:hypothetical protein